MYFFPYSSAGKAMADYLSWRSPLLRMYYDATGYNQMRNAEKSATTQISYNEYLAKGNQRALDDWNNTIGKKGHGREIRYPELSYPGRIAQARTGSTRAMYDIDTASANYYGNLPYRTAGLYGVASRLSRWF